MQNNAGAHIPIIFLYKLAVQLQIILVESKTKQTRLGGYHIITLYPVQIILHKMYITF